MLIIVGQKNLRPTVAGMYNYIQPLVATLVAVCWGMETFDPTKICSVLLTFQRCLSGDDKPQPGRCGEVPLTAGKPPETTVGFRTPHTQRPGNGEDPRKYRAFRPKYAEATLPDTDSE